MLLRATTRTAGLSRLRRAAAPLYPPATLIRSSAASTGSAFSNGSTTPTPASNLNLIEQLVVSSSTRIDQANTRIDQANVANVQANTRIDQFYMVAAAGISLTIGTGFWNTSMLTTEMEGVNAKLDGLVKTEIKPAAVAPVQGGALRGPAPTRTLFR